VKRLTQKELRAVNYALSVVLAGELDGEMDEFSDDDIQTAKDKIEARINWKAGE